MIRLFVSTALAAVVAAGAGCSSDSGGTSAPTSAPASAADNSAEVCASMKQSSSGFTQSLTVAAGQLQAAKGDVAKVTESLQAMQKVFGDFSTAIRADAARATNPELRQSLESLANAFDKTAKTVADPQSLAQDPTKILNVMSSDEVATAGKSLEKICGP